MYGDQLHDTYGSREVVDPDMCGVPGPGDILKGKHGAETSNNCNGKEANSYIPLTRVEMVCTHSELPVHMCV